MEKYYINSTKYSLKERQTKKHGRVYDLVFRVITMDGTVKQKKLSGYKTKTDAKAAYTQFVTEHCTPVKNNPIPKPDVQHNDLTIRELIPIYILSLNNQNKYSSISNKNSIYQLFVLPELGNLTPNQLTREKLYQWQDWLWAQKNPRTGSTYSYNYLKKSRGYFAAFLSWCESRYGYTNNISSVKIPKSRAPKHEMKFWNRDEFNQFISCVDDPIYHALFMVLFYTGRRRGEVLALQNDDIHDEYISFNKSVTFRTADKSKFQITSTKTEKTYTTPLCDSLKNELQNFPGQQPFFFGGDHPIPPETLRRKFYMYIKKSGVKQIRIHDLRHSFVSMIIHMGANILLVADLIGDTVEQVTKTYGHLYETDKISIIKSIG